MEPSLIGDRPRNRQSAVQFSSFGDKILILIGWAATRWHVQGPTLRSIPALPRMGSRPSISLRRDSRNSGNFKCRPRASTGPLCRRQIREYRS